MELLLVVTAVLLAVLLSGVAIGYISARDRRAPLGGPSALRLQQEYRAAEEAIRAAQRTPLVRAAGDPPSPAQETAWNAPASENTSPDSPDAADSPEDAVRSVLRTNQLQMADPSLTTLDRVQALMSSPAFALHRAERLEETPGHDKRDPR